MKMRWWPMLAVAGGLVMTAWANTIDVRVDRDPDARDVAERRLSQTVEALRRAERAYREHARADSLLPLLPSDPGVHVRLPDELPPADAALIDSAIARESSAIDTPHARIGVFLIDAGFGRRSHVPTFAGNERELHAGVDSAGAYCAMVGAALVHGDTMVSNGFGMVSSRGRRERTVATVLGPCAFYARYGAPGVGIGSWLRKGGYRFADVSGAHVREWGPREPRTGLWLWSDRDLWMRGCRGGREELCRAVLLEPTTVDAGSAAFALDRLEWYEASDTRRMLGSVEQQFGAERFARFWTNDQDVETAFASAFGLDATEWLAGWSAATWGAERLGAGIAAPHLLLSLLVLGVVAAISAAVAARRTI